MSWEIYLSHRRRGRRTIHNAKNGYNTSLIRRLATTHYNNNDTRPCSNWTTSRVTTNAKQLRRINLLRTLLVNIPATLEHLRVGGWVARLGHPWERCHLGVADDGVHCALEAQPWAAATPEWHRARTGVLHKCVSPKMMLSRKKQRQRRCRRHRRPANAI
jgi:hypothetical protein